MPERLSMGDDALELTFEWSAESPVHLAAVALEGSPMRLHAVPAVEILTAGKGHVPASSRLAHTQVGDELRYVDHTASADSDSRSLAIRQAADCIESTLELRQLVGSSAVRAQITVRNTGRAPVVLRAVPSWTSGFTGAEPTDDPLAGWERVLGRSDWLGEGRWERDALRGQDFPRLAESLTGHDPRGSLVRGGRGTWSTGGDLPVGALDNAARGVCLAWQVEHNGAWRAEIAEDTAGGYLSLTGPTDEDHAWTLALATGESFTTVPVTVSWAPDFSTAVASLTAYRRAARRDHADNARMPVVFNDYMNTLDGDPTTEKLLPLVAAAAAAGAEVFCIDAGWYDDSGHWWDSVGEWEPSTTRFPGGLDEVIEAIRGAGMVPGLWLEPEVVGVKSPVADSLPAEAFLQRHGARIVEHHRYHLDLRHPAAIAHLDSVIDRLIDRFGIGFFKLDYNINPGPGTDLDSSSVGDGLLRHNRAHLAWLDGVLDRHPDLIIENCSSGAMRMDFAMLSRLAMQSTSDQQDFVKYPPIAASAPLSMLPEQAASWAYPQPEMTDEEIAFCLVTGLLGRFYVSGYLNKMTDAQRARVATAVGIAKTLRDSIRSSDPVWPLGLPGWDDEWISLGLRAADSDLVSIWRRGASRDVVLELPHRRGDDVVVETVFPTDLTPWETAWDSSAGTLTVRTADTDGVAARTLRLAARSSRSAERS